MPSPLLALALPLALLAPVVPAAQAAPVASGTVTSAEATARAQARFPGLQRRPVVGDLQTPWDVQVLPGEGLLMTERDSARLSTITGGVRRTVDFPSDKVWVSGETGLMSLAVDPRFTDNRRFYTCSGWRQERRPRRPGQRLDPERGRLRAPTGWRPW